MTELYSRYCSCGYRVTTDSRAIAGGEMFFALRGENFDGNDYALAALEKGAAWAVVNDDADLGDDPRLIKVSDPFITLRDLATWHRNHVHDSKGSRLTVIGLTGTNGKTTTKELINAVLSSKYRVTATKGNLNNDIGVPLSLLSITPDTELAVIEMGANHPDDIAKLVKVSQPDCGLITNVGKAHLLGFGSFEGVKAAKGELYKWLGGVDGSVIFVNMDDADLCGMADAVAADKVGYGLEYQGAELLPTSAEEPFVRIRIGEKTVCTNLVGAYNATNVMAAIAVGAHFGVGLDAAAEAVASFVPKNNRSQLMKAGTNTLIVDAYNANPSSMNAALVNFASFGAARRLALLGDMRELGDDSLREHVAIVRKVQELAVEAIFVGDEFRKALDETGAEFSWYASSEDLAAALAMDVPTGAAILVKGSRGIQMEKVLPVLS